MSDEAHDFDLVQSGAIARELLTVIDEFKERRTNALLKRAFARIDDNKLSPDEAMFILVELRSVDALRKSLHSEAKRGEAAATRINKRNE